MPRGEISHEGAGYRGDPFYAGAGIKALVAAGTRDSVVGLPVVLVSGVNNTVDLGTDGDTIFGVIEVYEMDGVCTVQTNGYASNVPTIATSPTVGKVAALDGAGKVKDSTDGAGVKQAMIKKVTAKATTGGDATVTITAAGSVALADGKAITVTLDTTSTTTNATSIREAVAADADVAAYFTVGGTGTTIILTRKVAAVSEYESFDFALSTAVAAAMGETVGVDGIPDVKMRTPIFVEVDTTAKTATVFLG